MPDNKHVRRLLTLVYCAAGIAAAYLFVKYALKWVLPFITAFLISRAVEPLVRLLTARFRIKRAPASAICVFVAFAVVITLLSFAVGRIVYELSAFAKDIPTLLSDLSELFTSINSKLRGYILTAPPEIQEYLTDAMEGLSSQSAEMLTSLSRGILGFISNTAQSTPGIVLFLFTTGVSSFFISSEYSEITTFIVRQIPPRRRRAMFEMNTDMRGAFGKWVRAQLMLCGVTFLELFTLFLILRVKLSIVPAIIIALLDMLPVLGAGMALVPWGIFMLLEGNTIRGVTMLAGYAVISLVRNVLEPKFVGKQLGLPPVATLIAMYVGFCTAGIFGMALFPIALIIIKQLNDRGYVSLWK